MISLAKALFSLALLCLLTEKASAEESCVLNASTSTAVLQCAEFNLLPANARIPEDAESFQRVFDAPGWNRRSGTQWRFPGGADVLWLRFKIENRSEETVTRLLINEFAFADSLKLFWIQDGRVRTDEQGLQQSWIEKHIDYRLPAYSLRLEPGENRFLMRLEARSGKILSLKLEEPGSSGQRENFPGYLFPVFLTGAITAFVLSLFIFLSLQERIGLLYCIYVASMVAYMFSWEGYARQYLFPNHGTWSIAALSSSGALAGWAVIALWRELLILSVHAPLINRIMRWIGGGYIIAAVYSLIPGADFRLVDVAVYILPALFIPLALFSGVHVIRIGFRPALFSLIGFTGFLICIPFFFYAGMGWIQGSDWTRNPLYVGYLFEFAMFLISVGLRIHFLRNLQHSTMAPGTATRVASSDEPAPANQMDDSVELDKKAESAIQSNPSTGPVETKPATRLSKLNVGELSRMLDSLMTEEQLYCDEDLTQERLASLLEIKRHQLSELLRVVHGTNFYSYINRHRIACAQTMLLDEPERSVLSVALAAGFSSKSTFNSEFKKQTGMTPVEYRKSRATTTVT